MNEPSPSELARRLDDIKGEFVWFREKLLSLPDQNDMQSMGSAWVAQLQALDSRLDNYRQETDRRLTDIESWQMWALRLATGSILTGIIGAVIVFRPGP